MLALVVFATTGFVLTENTVIASITAAAGLLGVLLTTFGSVFVALAASARNQAKAARAELVPNGGSSARDALNRVEVGLASLAATVTGIDKRLTDHITSSKD